MFLTVDRFYPRAEQLRDVFDKRFADPLVAHAERFQWDFWHVPGEYTTLRTPAYHYFPKSVYEPFHRFLVRWGRENLGCHDISPSWLSCYVEGCRQYAHQDVPHGPLAFVFSLTRWQGRKFRGGETFIKKPKTMIEPKFNRLTLFNPSLVHGVREVRGTLDPRLGRLVVHGWFVQPRPFWIGPLTARQVEDGLNQGLSRLDLSNPRLSGGLVSMRLVVKSSGEVERVEILVNTLPLATKADIRELARKVAEFRFARQRSPSKLTLPLMLTR